MMDVQKIRSDFPILARKVHEKPLVYFDNAATTQKPRSVIGALTKFYGETNANVHRGIHTLSEEATDAYEGSRKTVADFVGAGTEEIVFTRGTTEAINLIASTWGEQNIGAGDEIVLTILEHHSNIVPWQQLAKRKGATIRYIDVTDDGLLDLRGLSFISPKKTKLVAVTMMSNVLGTITPLDHILDAARLAGAVTVVDGAQGVPHMGVNVKELGCDFLAFSSHKMCGPTGVGILYGRRELLEKMPPYQFGGDMIQEVLQDRSTWNELPWKFEAGTPNIADVVAFRSAIEYVQNIGFGPILAHARELTAHTRKKLGEIKGVHILGPDDPSACGGIVSFTIDGVHAHDIGSILDSDGVAIRTGHHCAQPLMQRLQVTATARMSFYFYNTVEEIDAAVQSVQKVLQIFKPA